MTELTGRPSFPNSDRAEMNDIIDHLNARLDEDEQTARDAMTLGMVEGKAEPEPQPWWTPPEDGAFDRTQVIVGAVSEVARTPDEYRAQHIARHDPARELREVAALRQVINDYRAADRACMGSDAGSPEYAAMRAARDAFKSVLRAYAAVS